MSKGRVEGLGKRRNGWGGEEKEDEVWRWLVWRWELTLYLPSLALPIPVSSFFPFLTLQPILCLFSLPPQLFFYLLICSLFALQVTLGYRAFCYCALLLSRIHKKLHYFLYHAQNYCYHAPVTQNSLVVLTIGWTTTLDLNFSYRFFGYCAPYPVPIMRDSRGLPVIQFSYEARNNEMHCCQINMQCSDLRLKWIDYS